MFDKVRQVGPLSSPPVEHGPAPRADQDPRSGRRPLGAGHIDAVLAARVRPTSARRDQFLPVLTPLAPLLPGGHLARGAVVAVAPGGGGAGAGGGTSLAFALLAAASNGSWCGAVGTADPGVVALTELGVDLRHLVLVPRPGGQWAQVTATLLDGLDVVLLRPPGVVGPGVARRLAARARDAGTALVVLGPARAWPEGADLRVTVRHGRWEGIGTGHGHLRCRRVEVEATGRRAAARTVVADLWLPGPSGGVGAVAGAGAIGARDDARDDAIEQCGE